MQKKILDFDEKLEIRRRQMKLSNSSERDIEERSILWGEGGNSYLLKPNNVCSFWSLMPITQNIIAGSFPSFYLEP